MNNNNNFDWLQKWYFEQCDGDWEHAYGVKIGTLDNPGWSVEIDLIGTGLENHAFNNINVKKTKNNWIYCRVNEGKFEAACGPTNLSEIIQIFQNWVKSETDNI